MKEGLTEKVLFKGEADEYASIINDNPISHDDCISILKVAVKLKSIGCSNELIINRLRQKESN
jgi:hypothetical protein